VNPHPVALVFNPTFSNQDETPNRDFMSYIAMTKKFCHLENKDWQFDILKPIEISIVFKRVFFGLGHCNFQGKM